MGGSYFYLMPWSWRCWLWATCNHRAGIVDVRWSFCIALNIVITALFVDIAPLNVRLFIGILSSIWFYACFHLFLPLPRRT